MKFLYLQIQKKNFNRESKSFVWETSEELNKNRICRSIIDVNFCMCRPVWIKRSRKRMIVASKIEYFARFACITSIKIDKYIESRAGKEEEEDGERRKNGNRAKKNRVILEIINQNVSVFVCQKQFFKRLTTDCINLFARCICVEWAPKKVTKNEKKRKKNNMFVAWNYKISSQYCYHNNNEFDEKVNKLLLKIIPRNQNQCTTWRSDERKPINE